MGKRREAKRDTKAVEKLRRSVEGQSLADVGVPSMAGLACPVCSGTQFRTGRHIGSYAFGALGLLAAKTRLECIACGTTYVQGAPSRTPGPPPPTSAPVATQPPGWYTDPVGRYAQRWWGGVTWTADVIDKKGRQTQDPKAL